MADQDAVDRLLRMLDRFGTNTDEETSVQNLIKRRRGDLWKVPDETQREVMDTRLGSIQDGRMSPGQLMLSILDQLDRPNRDDAQYADSDINRIMENLTKYPLGKAPDDRVVRSSLEDILALLRTPIARRTTSPEI